MLKQVDEPESVDRQALGVTIKGSDIIGTNLNGDIFQWGAAEQPTQSWEGHKGLIDAHAVAGNYYIHSSNNQLFSTDLTASTWTMLRATGLTNKQRIDVLCTNQDHVYGCSYDNTVQKCVLESGRLKLVASASLPSKAVGAACDDSHLYVLCMNKSICVFNSALEFTTTYQPTELAQDVTALALAGSELWVGDKSGKLHVFGTDGQFK